MLALLLLEANRVVPSETADRRALGRRRRRRRPRKALQVYVSRLRKALGGGRRIAANAAAGLRARARAGSARPEALRRHCARGACRPSPARAAAALHEALALWRGAAAGRARRRAVRGRRRGRARGAALGALEERIDADLALGRHTELIPELDALVAEHPYRERFRAQQMLALYRSGRQAEALAAYRRPAMAYVEGLGIEPGPTLKALERAVLDQDPALAAPAGGGRRRGPAGRGDDAYRTAALLAGSPSRRWPSLSRCATDRSRCSHRRTRSP